ncbi:hypothetical protein [Enterococcus olivae]
MANWRDVVALCSEEKIYFEPYYYRFREHSDNQYELARLVAGSCGEFTYHPKITVKVENDLFVPIAYYNNEQNPVQQLTRDEDETFLDEEFVALLDVFLEAKEAQKKPK